MKALVTVQEYDHQNSQGGRREPASPRRPKSALWVWIGAGALLSMCEPRFARRSGHFSFHRVRCRGRAQVARPGVKLLCSLSHRPFLLCENLNSQSQWVHRAHPKSDEEKSKLSLNKASRATSLPHRRGSPRPRCILDVPWREDSPSAPQEGRRKPWEGRRKTAHPEVRDGSGIHTTLPVWLTVD